MPDDPPPDDRRADVEAFIDEQLRDLNLPRGLDAQVRGRIRDLALGQAQIRVPPRPAARNAGP